VEPAVVEPVDVFGRRDFEIVDASPGSFVADQFGFEERVERLREDNRSCHPWIRPRRRPRRRRDGRCIEWLDILETKLGGETLPLFELQRTLSVCGFLTRCLPRNIGCVKAGSILSFEQWETH
jgi:hypothetical protein